MFGAASTSDIVTFLQRKDATLLANKTPLEAWRAYLIKNTGLNGGISELEKAWLNKQGGTGNTIHDALTNYFNAKGFNKGGRSDSVKNYANGIVTP